MKALKVRLDDGVYERFKRLHPNYGEESRVFRELVEQYIQQQERRGVREWGELDEPHKV